MTLVIRYYGLMIFYVISVTAEFYIDHVRVVIISYSTRIGVSQVMKREKVSPRAYNRLRSGFTTKEMMKLKMHIFQRWRILRGFVISSYIVVTVIFVLYI